ncbi:hypothetical protein [Acidomonas methanolica]|uniref:Uncharacterized protein n=1 Tax=Acidomonas methanolica NBRC 104435 TaxID=1231351 RepID=A0A023D5I2_ACIMT|nr:hypothetical protein [Acidomonas methanolica]MBU2655072.1 hypothetical protein [Acidomonas methanolica]TCS29482.1 hypothetical protein EDC31_10651 [Acidomonas methanolica]GAJ29324.1 hypothetical protein Amme_059_043 [Acidomonas methanolica NBRC 104435]GBQ45557.1 hypothetical protein AA0498_0081 [Acidomonas methanolica]GEK99088.1 hypothetical protein AME01nite_15870 [Acidomonas methanolica NBRC 104435]
MSLPLPSALHGRRIPWFRIAAIGWLLAVSLIALADRIALARLVEQTRRNDPNAQIGTLSARVIDLERLIAAERRQPKPASAAELTAMRRSLDVQIAHLKEAQAAFAHVGDVQALQARMTDIEARQEQDRVTLTTVQTTPRRTSAPPRPLAPPFRVGGIELRGGEPFLSIAPLATGSLASVRLLHPGESERGWQLQRLDPHAALFRVNGTAQRVILP